MTYWRLESCFRRGVVVGICFRRWVAYSEQVPANFPAFVIWKILVIEKLMNRLVFFIESTLDHRINPWNRNPFTTLVQAMHFLGHGFSLFGFCFIHLMASVMALLYTPLPVGVYRQAFETEESF
jgi:hypothetical protein